MNIKSNSLSQNGLIHSQKEKKKIILFFGRLPNQIGFVLGN